MKRRAKHVRGTLGTGENQWFTPDEHLERARHAERLPRSGDDYARLP